MKKFSLISIAFIICYLTFLPACFPPFEPKEPAVRPDTTITDTVRPAPEIPTETTIPVSISEQAMMATLFQQRAAEYRALCYQAFNMARIVLERDLRDESVILPRAVIVDIDETMLDNSPHSSKCIEKATSYPAYWDEWCELEKARAVPGALEFMKLARNYGVALYYISNRKELLKEATMSNLRKLGFPQAEDANVILRTAESGKENRRKAVASNHHISMLIGDNLADFSDIFEHKNVTDRAQITDSLRNEFGRRFILLPNAMYGDWENALYEYNFTLSDSAKMSMRRGWLESF